ncbi:MAG: arsenite efflux transporter metallochaperone ArsD [Phycisphaeraceae bacterium]
MKRLEVFDPAMCCSTGLCGTDVDPKLVQFAADLDWLRGQGVQVQRFNLSQEPMAFVKHEGVRQIVVQTHGKGLPVVVVDGELVSQARYPSRSELAAFVELDAKELRERHADVALTVATTDKAKTGGSCCGPTGCC